MRLAICVAVAFALASCARGAGEAMQITDNGNPVAMIVVPDAATATEQFAAEELRSYLAQISGAELPIEAEAQAPEGARLLVGATSAGQQARQALAEGDPDAFTVRTVGNDPLLVGATDRGTLYAVYDFLEDDLGCRWLGPGPDWEDIPSQPSITIGDLDRTESPAMKYRFLRMTVVGEPETWKDYCMSWAVKQKINIGSGWPQTELPEQISKRGGFRAWMSPHVIKSILDVDEHFDEHPEWYALRGGARKNTGRNTQLCTTNPEVVEGQGHLHAGLPSDLPASGPGRDEARAERDDPGGQLPAQLRLLRASLRARGLPASCQVPRGPGALGGADARRGDGLRV